MVCKNCGSQMKDGDIFCQKCGTKNLTSEGEILQEEQPTVIEDKKITVHQSANEEIAAQNAALKQLWPDWTIIEKLGEGSFGKVYRATREEMGSTFESAIKIITIPQNASEADTIKAEIGLDEQSTTSYFRALVDDCVNEIKMMENFKGTQNIVSVEDYKVVAHTGEIGWTIFIRMELLTSFNSYSKNKVLTEKDVIKLGIDICSALENCSKLNVMHRDIKPENIFISKFGDFKLGDFGIARKLEKSTSGMSKKGTYNYMAPEVYSGRGQYDFKSDIYSLGIVLYKLLNNNRFPLIDARSVSVTYTQMQDAFEKRMSGAALPKPLNASDALSSVILAACSYNPRDRFATATAMKKALQNVQSGKADKIVPDPIASQKHKDSPVIPPVKPIINPTKTKPEKTPKPEKKKKEKKKMSKGKKALAIIIAVLVIIVGIGGYLGISYLTGAEYKIIKALNNENYSEAVDVYKADMNGDASRTLLVTLGSRLDKIKEDFSTEAIEYSVANMEVSTVEKMGIKEADFEKKLKDTKDYISSLNTSRTAFGTAETMFEKGDYSGAITNYQKVIENDTNNYEAAKAKLVSATENYRSEILKEAADYVTQNSYTKAIATLEAALKVLVDDAKINEQLELYNKEFQEKTKDDAVKTAKSYADKADYEAAIKTLQTALKSSPDDVDITTDLKVYSEKYVESIISEVDGLTDKKNYVAAIELLEKALGVLPGNDTLTAKQASVNASKPVSLSSLTPINGGWEWNEGTPTDPFEVTYTSVSNFKIFNGSSNNEYSAEYRLYGKYKTLTGSLVSHIDIAEKGYSQIKIYADETLVYTSPNIERKTDLLDFSAPIENADYIKIVVTVKDNYYDWGGHNGLILLNAQLWTE